MSCGNSIGCEQCLYCPNYMSCMTYKNTVEMLALLQNGSDCDLTPVLEAVLISQTQNMQQFNTLNTKIDNLLTNLDQCCEKLENKIENIDNNLTKCCDEINSKLDVVIDICDEDEDVKHWLPFTEYFEGDLVRQSGIIYKCLKQHISQSSETPKNTPELWEAQAEKLENEIALLSDVANTDNSGTVYEVKKTLFGKEKVVEVKK